MIQGKVGSKVLKWEQIPRGKTGESVVEINGKSIPVRWNRDDQGIWIETDQGVVGYDVRKNFNDDGKPEYTLLNRRRNELITGIGFLKAGEEEDASAAAKAKKGAKIKSQMPGKILRIHVAVGVMVKKGQSVMVMEAMKMENEIKSPHEGTIKEIRIAEGQNVETGADLIVFD